MSIGLRHLMEGAKLIDGTALGEVGARGEKRNQRSVTFLIFSIKSLWRSDFDHTY
jgi:hypothetical protein